MESVEPPVMAPVPRLVAQDASSFRIAVWENVSLLHWTGQATLDAVERIQQVTDSMVRRFPEGHSSVSFIADGVPMPTPEARDALCDSFDDRISQIRCMAQIIEGEGFWASALRSAITNLNLGSSRNLAMRVCASIQEVAGWLPQEHAIRTGAVLDSARLQRALRTFRNGA